MKARKEAGNSVVRVAANAIRRLTAPDVLHYGGLHAQSITPKTQKHQTSNWFSFFPPSSQQGQNSSQIFIKIKAELKENSQDSLMPDTTKYLIGAPTSKERGTVSRTSSNQGTQVMQTEVLTGNWRRELGRQEECVERRWKKRFSEINECL